MRITLIIEDEAFQAIRKYAEEREVSLGQAASDLVSMGVRALPQFQMEDGWVIFNSAPGALPLTNGLLAEQEKRDFDEEFSRAFSPRR